MVGNRVMQSVGYIKIFPVRRELCITRFVHCKQNFTELSLFEGKVVFGRSFLNLKNGFIDFYHAYCRNFKRVVVIISFAAYYNVVCAGVYRFACNICVLALLFIFKGEILYCKRTFGVAGGDITVYRRKGSAVVGFLDRGKGKCALAFDGYKQSPMSVQCNIRFRIYGICA